MKTQTPLRYTAYTGSRRRIQPIYVQFASPVRTQTRSTPLPTILCVLALALFAMFTLSHLSYPAYAADSDSTYQTHADPKPTAPKVLTTEPTNLLENSATTDHITNLNTQTTPSANPITASAKNPDATYIYISCPIEIYRGTLDNNEPAEYLVDDFEDIPEHWLYVLTPLNSGENYFFTLDLACRTESSPLKGDISTTYSSYVPDDGSLGTVRIEATEEIAPNTFLVYYGELKYISDCSSLTSDPSDNTAATFCLTQNSYGHIYDHHLFYFSLTTTDLPTHTQPVSELRASHLSDPAVQASVSIAGNAECQGTVYDEDLLQSDYMYPYRKYDPADGSQPENVAYNSSTLSTLV